MCAGDGIFDPLCHIHGMVADALEILCDHQKIEALAAQVRVLGDLTDRTKESTLSVTMRLAARAIS